MFSDLVMRNVSIMAGAGEVATVNIVTDLFAMNHTLHLVVMMIKVDSMKSLQYKNLEAVSVDM